MKRLILCLLVAGLCFCLSSRAGTPSRIRVYTGLDKPVVLAGSEGEVVLKVGLTAVPAELESVRLPINLAIVLDKSGSMSSNDKMENAKQGAIEIIERLSRDDIVSVIIYDNSPRVLVSAQPLKNKDKIIRLIKSIRANGSTALYGGVTLGAQEVREYFSGEYLNRIILLSDGLANVGPQSTEELAHLGIMLNKEEISVTTIGVGVDYNEDLMTALAQKGGGNAYFAYNSDELPKIFAEEIGEAMTVSARKVKIRVDCLTARPLDVIGREGRVGEKEMEVTIGTLYAKNDKYALFSLEVGPQKKGKVVKVARVYVEYVDPFNNRKQSLQQNVTLTCTKDKNLVEESRDRSILKDFALTRTSEIKSEAVRLADKGKYDEAAKILKTQSIELEKVSRECDNDKDILKEAENCEEISGKVNAHKGFSRSQRKQALNEWFSQTGQQGYSAQGVNYKSTQ